jgi:hypothetical protein
MQISLFSIDRSIKELWMIPSGRMTEQISKWWEGLAKELEVDIEAPEE